MHRVRSWSILIPLATLAACLPLLPRPLDFDEGAYFTIAGNIRDTGYPVWSWDGSRHVLFQNSPPALLYFGAAVGRGAPADAAARVRVLHYALFVVPLMLAVWAVLVRRYGAFPAAVAFLVTFGTWFYLYELMRFRMDAPVGAVSALALYFFCRAAKAARPSWELAAAASCAAAAMAIKYQAVCLVASAAAFAVAVRVTGSAKEYPRLWAALVAIIVGVVVSVGACYALAAAAHAAGFHSHNPMSSNLGRIGGASRGETVRVFALTTQAVATKTGFLFALFGVAWAIAGNRRDDLAALAACHVAVTAAFNVATSGMPGAGGYYLAGAVPALTVAVAWAVATVRTGGGRARFGAVAALLLAMHLVVNLPKVNLLLDRTEPGRGAGAAVAAHTTPGEIVAVSGQRWAVGYYADRPQAHIEYVEGAQADAMLGGAAGAVVLDEGYLQTPAGGRAAATLDLRYVPVAVFPGVPGDSLHVYVRRDRPVR